MSQLQGEHGTPGEPEIIESGPNCIAERVGRVWEDRFGVFGRAIVSLRRSSRGSGEPMDIYRKHWEM